MSNDLIKDKAVYDEDSSGKIIMCPQCGARASAASTSNKIPFSHVRLQEDHSAIKSINPDGSLVTDLGGDLQIFGGENEYLACGPCGTNFTFEGKVSVDDPMGDYDGDYYITESNIERTFCYNEDEYYDDDSDDGAYELTVNYTPFAAPKNEDYEHKNYTPYGNTKDTTDSEDNIPF